MAFLLVWCATACAPSRDAVALDAALSQHAVLLVTLEVPVSGPVRVHVVVPRAQLPEAPAELRFSWIRVPPAVAARQLRGSLSPRLVSREADLALDYEMAIEPFTRAAGLHGSFSLAHGRQLALWNLLPVMSGAVRSEALGPAVVRVLSKEPVSSSLSGGPTVFRAETPNELYSALLLVGPVTELPGSDGLRVVSFDFGAEALSAVVALERRASKVLTERYGARRPLTLLAVHAAPEGLSGNGVLGVNVAHTASVLFHAPPAARPTTLDNNRLLHELVHSSLPPEEGLPGWMTEGFAEYVARRLSVQLDALPPEALRESLSATWDAFVEGAPDRRPREGNIAAYYGGAVLAHCIDVRLRRDGSSLDAVLKRVRARAAGEITNALWEQEIALASSAAGARVLAAKTEPLDPIATCFAEEEHQRQPRRKGVSPGFVRRLLGITSVNDEPRHFDVMVSSVEPGPQVLRVGDVITALDGVRVVSLAQLQELLLSSPARVTLAITRGGRSETLTVPLGPVERRSAVEVDRALWLPRP